MSESGKVKVKAEAARRRAEVLASEDMSRADKEEELDRLFVRTVFALAAEDFEVA